MKSIFKDYPDEVTGEKSNLFLYRFSIKITVSILFVIGVFSAHLHAQKIFSDRSSLAFIDSSDFYTWADETIADTIIIGMSDTILPINDSRYGNFYAYFRTIELFRYVEIVRTDSLITTRNIPSIIRYGDGDSLHVTLNQYRTKPGSNLNGWSYSEKNNFKKIVYALISESAPAKTLYISILRSDTNENSLSVK